MQHSTPQPSSYQTITHRIIEAIEAGAGDFVMPWHGGSARTGRPANAATGRPYAGGNAVGLWAEAMLRGHSSRFWATYRQWQDLGAQVRKGERSATIVFYKQLDTERDGEDGLSARLIARSSHVFNADQVDGWEEENPLPPCSLVDTLEHVEAFVSATAVEVRHHRTEAFYDRALDQITVPEPRYFLGTLTSSATEAYYATLLHELVHWTGAPHRLNREYGKRFGDAAYAAEELVAELGAAFLCSDLGVRNEPRPDHAAYVGAWLAILKQDARAIFTAAKLATEATQYLHALQ